MGLFDKIKKAIDDSGVVDAAKAAVKSFTEPTESKTVETPQKQIVEEKVAEKEVKETKPKAPPKPACEHGNCVLCQGSRGDEKELFFTCPAETACPKKQKYPIGEIWDEELFPIIEAYSKYDIMKFGDSNEAKIRSAANKIVKTYVPQLSSYDFVTFVKNKLAGPGITKWNTLLVYFVNLKRRGVEIPSNKKAAYVKIAELIADDLNIKKRFVNADDDWLYNPSLYEIKYPEYTFRAFSLFSNKKWLESHLLDPSVVNIQEFYNEDGTIKRAGDEHHPDEDSIFNLVEKWGVGNENQEVFAKEAEERKAEEERKRIEKMCNSCARGHNCQVKYQNPNCPAFLPKSRY